MYYNHLSSNHLEQWFLNDETFESIGEVFKNKIFVLVGNMWY